jgi:hypothetical protein
MEIRAQQLHGIGIRAALRTIAAVLGIVFTAMPFYAQDSVVTQPAATSDLALKPLPDIPALMRAVEANQRNSESLQKNYIYHSTQIAQQSDGHGGVKKTETREFEIFWINGVPVRRLLRKDGKDLSPDELKDENERIDKQAAKARERRDRADADGKETDPHGHDEITVSRLLELGSFTNPRRVSLNDRDTIAVDYAGDPKAKTRNRSEEVIRDLQGTVWIDEQDQVLAQVEGHFLNTFKIAGGLVANIQKGTSFSLEMKKVNGEVWLPALASGRGAMRVMLFFSFNGEGRMIDSDYRKFRATSTILPDSQTPGGTQNTTGPPPSPSPQ